MTRLSLALLAVCLHLCVAVAADPKAAFDEQYEPAALEAIHSTDPEAMPAFATKLVEDARALRTKDREYALLLLERACDYGARQPHGLVAAMNAATLLMEELPDQRCLFVDRVLTLQEQRVRTATGEIGRASCRERV